MIVRLEHRLAGLDGAAPSPADQRMTRTTAIQRTTQVEEVPRRSAPITAASTVFGVVSAWRQRGLRLHPRRSSSLLIILRSFATKDGPGRRTHRSRSCRRAGPCVNVPVNCSAARFDPRTESQVGRVLDETIAGMFSTIKSRAPMGGVKSAIGARPQPVPRRAPRGPYSAVESRPRRAGVRSGRPLSPALGCTRGRQAGEAAVQHAIGRTRLETLNRELREACPTRR